MKRALVLACALAGCASAPRAAVSPVSDGGITLRVDGLPPGVHVTVAGTFNGWDVHGPALREALPGRYEAFVDLEPGVHRLQLVVRSADGRERWIPPPGLSRYEPDGFGGSNAVVEIARNLSADGSSYEVK